MKHEANLVKTLTHCMRISPVTNQVEFHYEIQSKLHNIKVLNEHFKIYFTFVSVFNFKESFIQLDETFMVI